jgi:uncharacterized protein YndB with AHSA1/START domain
VAANSATTAVAALSGGCVRVQTQIDIACPPQVVFDYVTTPALWHTWHPATVAVLGVLHRPLVKGESALEVIAVGGRRDKALWTVLACNPPHQWEIATDTTNGSARIVYQLTPIPDGSRFERTLEFRSKHRLWRSLDSTLTRWILKRQSATALHNLKSLLEHP